MRVRRIHLPAHRPLPMKEAVRNRLEGARHEHYEIKYWLLCWYTASPVLFGVILICSVGVPFPLA